MSDQKPSSLSNKKNGVRTEYQLILPLSPWVDCVYENVYTRKVDGRLFTNTLLRDFDLTICRCAIFDSNYVQRRAGKSVIKLYARARKACKILGPLRGMEWTVARTPGFYSIQMDTQNHSSKLQLKRLVAFGMVC